MLDFLSQRTRVPLVHATIFITTLASLSFIFWNIFSLAPIGLTTGFSFFWFFLTFLFGVFSQASSTAFPYLFTFLPSTRERDRFVPMRAVFYVLTTSIAALCLGIFAPIFGQHAFSFLGHFIDSDTMFVALFVATMSVAYGAGIRWAGFFASSNARTHAIRIPFSRRSTRVFSDIVYAAFSFMIDTLSFLWLPLLVVALRGDILFGAYMLFAFALGRGVPVFILSLYSAFHIDVSSWLLHKRKTVEYAIAGTYVLVAVFFLSFSSEVFVQILPFFREHRAVVHIIADGILPILLVLPFWLYFFAEYRRVFGAAHKQLSAIRTHMEALTHIKDRIFAHCLSSLEHAQVCLPRIEKDLERLAYQADMLSSAVRHRLSAPLRAQAVQKNEERSLWGLLVSTSLISAAIITLYYVFL